MHNWFCEIELSELIWQKEGWIKEKFDWVDGNDKKIKETTKLTTYSQRKANIRKKYSLTFVICWRKMFSSTTAAADE